MQFARGARRYAWATIVVAAIGFLVTPGLSVLAIALGAAALLFLRDPDRQVPPAGIVSPADGRVSVIRVEDGQVRVGVYMRLRDVHVTRAPLDGTVESVVREPGAYRPAFSKDSERNERVRIRFDGYEVILIAGAFARRITPYVEAGDRVARGARIGHIAFGSRVDVRLPPGVERDDLRVAEGSTVRAGETVIAPEP